MCAWFLIPTSAAASAVSLTVPQSTAFAVLGHSCGGIREQVLVTGFYSGSRTVSLGLVGNVFLITRCSTGGRRGGTVTYSAWMRARWTFSGIVESSYVRSTPPTVNPTLTKTDARGDTIYNQLTAINVTPANCAVMQTAYCFYSAYVTARAPAAPTGANASQVDDRFDVTWDPAPTIEPVLTAMTITATPVGSAAPTLTASVDGAATSGEVGPLAPQTTYDITVTASDAGGPGPRARRSPSRPQAARSRRALPPD